MNFKYISDFTCAKLEKTKKLWGQKQLTPIKSWQYNKEIKEIIMINYICSGHSIPNNSKESFNTFIVIETTFNLAIFIFSFSTLI